MKIETKVKLPRADSVVEIYPVLAKLIDGGLDDLGKIVLFSSANVGTVVHSTNLARLAVGYSNCNWISPYCKFTWEILPPGSEVVLKQL